MWTLFKKGSAWFMVARVSMLNNLTVFTTTCMSSMRKQEFYHKTKRLRNAPHQHEYVCHFLPLISFILATLKYKLKNLLGCGPYTVDELADFLPAKHMNYTKQVYSHGYLMFIGLKLSWYSHLSVFILLRTMYLIILQLFLLLLRENWKASAVPNLAPFHFLSSPN